MRAGSGVVPVTVIIYSLCEVIRIGTPTESMMKPVQNKQGMGMWGGTQSRKPHRG